MKQYNNLVEVILMFLLLLYAYSLALVEFLIKSGQISLSRKKELIDRYNNNHLINISHHFIV